jgi:hypothetical protein
MEGGLSDRALKVLRTVLHEKVGMDLDSVLDPALVADQLSLTELACVRSCSLTVLQPGERRRKQSHRGPGTEQKPKPFGSYAADR